MPKGKDREKATLPTHGAAVLPSVEVDSYNLEVEDEDGFVGDKASKGAFREMLDKWRQPLRELRRGPARGQADRRDKQEEARCAARQGLTRRRPAWCRAPWRSSRSSSPRSSAGS